jgi:hypothetical protein
VNTPEEHNMQVNAERVVASLSRQIGEQAQRIAMLEAIIEERASKESDNND